MGAFRLVVQRAAASWLLLSGAFVTVLVAATLVAAIPIYSDAVAEAGLERALASAPVEETTVEISAHVPAEDYAAADARVTGALGRTFAASGADLHRGGRSSSFTLLGRGAGALTVFGFLEGIERHADLVAGTWPGRGVAVEAALSEPAARALGVSLGAVLPVAARTGEERRLDVRVSGVFRALDPAAAFWRASPLELGGVQRADFTTFGPLVVPRATFFELAAGAEEVRWRAAPSFAALEVEEVGPLRRALERLDDRLAAGGTGFQVDGGLAGLLRDAERSLLVARSGVLVPSLQLAILAAYALLFTAFLIAEERRVETALLAARGADGRRIATVALLEGALLAVPAALAGPWVAAASLRLLERVGPLAEIDLALSPRVGPEAYGLAAVASAACVVALVVPALRSPRVALAVAAIGRPPARGIVQRARLDVVLLALALLAYWQLRRYGAPLIEDAQGRLGIDPLLVAAPALGLLAGAVLALRIVPALTRLAERLGGPARGVVAPLGVRQLSRRPRGYARSALLLTLALAIGLFAAAFGSTWSRSQEDQAAYETGADVRVRPDERSGALPAVAFPRAYEALEGVRKAVPVVEDTFALDGPRGAVVALDAAEAASVVSLRSDLAGRPVERVFDPLVPERPVLAGLGLPGEPTRLAVTARVDLDPRVRRFGFFGGVPGLESFAVASPSLALVLRDRAGLLHWYRAGELGRRQRARRFEIELVPPVAGGAEAAPAYPLELVAVELTVIAPYQVSREGILTVESLEAGPPGALRSVPLTPAPWSVREPDLPYAERAPRGLLEADAEGLDLFFTTGATSQTEAEVVFRLFPGAPSPPKVLPALATSTFLDASEARPGELFPVELAGARRSIEIAGSLSGVPTVEPATPALVIDPGTYGELVYLARATRPEASSWWLDTAPGEAESVAETLRAAPFSSAEAVSRQGRAAALQNDPVALGTIGALSLGFLAAAVFAAVGFAVSSAVSARERTTEFAVVRSLGLSSRQLTGWLVLENGLLVALSLAGGTALGLLLAHFVLPTVSLTQTGARPFPRPIVEVPWVTVAWLEAAMLLALVLIIALEVRLLRKVDVAAAVRAGEVR
ncbi:MAG TPA: ABC transporter permease [Gaiellaceae bacterium]|nr:ABC transporter permease [Gaiellaceae bacterium]